MIIIGNKYGNWTVQKKEEDGGRYHYYQCQCDCGSTKRVRSDALGKENSTYCRNCRHKDKVIRVGQKFGRWTVIQDAEIIKGRRYYRVQCDCGLVRSQKGARLQFGDSLCCRSCGSTKHGLVHSPIYTSWESMIQRCHNPKGTKYKYYGGKGIQVCDRWKSFQNFLDDMGHREKGLEIDRIDANGNYEPRNCQWITHTENLKRIKKAQL